MDKNNGKFGVKPSLTTSCKDNYRKTMLSQRRWFWKLSCIWWQKLEWKQKNVWG